MQPRIYVSDEAAREHALQELPALFVGSLSLWIIACTAEWGPLRLSKIDRMRGKTMNSCRTGQSARALEKMGVVVVRKRQNRHTKVELDRRHPAANQIRWFGRAFYRLYLAPIVKEPPAKRAEPLCPKSPKHDPASLDMHILGSDTRIRTLHFLAEATSCPTFVIKKFLGASHALHNSLQDLERHGILVSRAKEQTRYVKLDRRSPLHYTLWRLLKKLNTYLPEYAAMATIYRSERDKGHYTHKYKVREGLDRSRVSA